MILKHVLVPLDGSPLAEQALIYAENLVRDAGKLTLLMAIQLPANSPIISPSPPILPGELQDYAAHRQEVLLKTETYLHQLAQKLSITNVEFQIVDSNDPAEVIVEAAQEKQVDAIAMSTHGRSGLSRWLMGSVTQKVLQAAPCPIFVIPSRVVEQHKE